MMKGSTILSKYEYDAKYSKKYCDDNDMIQFSWRDPL